MLVYKNGDRLSVALYPKDIYIQIIRKYIEEDITKGWPHYTISSLSLLEEFKNYNPYVLKRKRSNN